MATRKETDLRKEMFKQLNRIKQYIEYYNNGDREAAMEMATKIRVLLHDTKRSKSILGQLGKKDRLFLDTSGDCLEDGNLMHGNGLVFFSEDEFVPKCDYPDFKSESDKLVNFDNWWNEKIIIIDELKNTFTRKDLILTMVNKDGGAHYDMEVDDKYDELTRKNSIGLKCSIYNSPPGALKNIGYASVRQITHEVLKTLLPSYEPPKVKHKFGIVLRGMRAEAISDTKKKNNEEP